MQKYDQIESRAYSAFKQVRNKIREYFPKQIVMHAIRYLHHPKSNEIQFITTYEPWLLLIIIKWTIEFGDYSRDKKNCTIDNFNQILNLTKNYTGNCRMPKEYPNLIMFFRALAFQQFWLMENFTKNRLARQKLLFYNLESNHNLRLRFEEISGISLDNFQLLGFTLVSRFIDKKELFVEEKWFDTISDKFPVGTIKTFLEFFSLDINNLRKYLQSIGDRRNFSTEIYEQTPLKKYPLLKFDDNYYCYLSDLLSTTIENVIFDIMKEAEPQKFSEVFGRVFENHIKDLLKHYSIHFITEKELSKYFKGGEKRTDIIIPEQEKNILIDAKGVELPKLGMLTHVQNILVDKTNTSLLKGIEQGFSTSQKIATDHKVKEILSGNTKNYLLIISFKDLYVGNGKDFYEYVAKDKLDKIISSYPKAKLQFEDIYFLSVDDFDLLLETKNKTSKSFSEILELARKGDQSKETKKFLFRMHLEEILKLDNMERANPNYIENAFFELTNKCAELLK